MCENLDDLIRGVREFVGSIGETRVPAQRAVSLVTRFTELERLAVAGRLLAAKLVQETRAWRATGAASAKAWMANEMGSTLTEAAAVLTTANHLEDLPVVRNALVDGRLSQEQVTEISVAAIADSDAEKRLVDLAERESLTALRETCRDVRAAAAGDEDAGERIRLGRYFRHRTESDGAVRIDARLTPEDAAPFLAAVRARAERLFLDALRSGAAESWEAYAAGALVSLVDGAGAPKAVVHVHVSSSALERGHTVAGETCRVDGVGPITVSAAQPMMTAGIVNILETDGVDVHRVAHRGRTIPAHLRTAIEARDPTCVVPGCDRHERLEIDHVTPLARGGITELGNLARLCRWHHAQKTHHGWRLQGEPGNWIWTRGRRDRSPPARGG